MTNIFNRRDFITKATIGSLGAIAIPDIVLAATANTATKKINLNAGDVILFQGDSITEWGRNKQNTTPNSYDMLGNGYVYMAAADVLLKQPDKKISIYNKGISGNKAYQLAERWDNDCMGLKPNVLSVMVGVNDYWHTLTNGYQGTIETYRKDYKALLDRTKQAFPDLKLIIGEPFAVKGVGSIDDKWLFKFNDYRAVSKEIASSFDAVFVPYQSIFDEAIKAAPGNYWSSDGVHPTIAGASLMAHSWLKAIR